MCDKNLLPRPSPECAPLTSPAISTNSINEGIVFSGLFISDNLFNLSSGIFTLATFGSIVQKGKFSASIFCEVSALNKVDLPTFGNPTIPHLMLILNEVYSLLSTNQDSIYRLELAWPYQKNLQ